MKVIFFRMPEKFAQTSERTLAKKKKWRVLALVKDDSSRSLLASVKLSLTWTTETLMQGYDEDGDVEEKAGVREA